MSIRFNIQSKIVIPYAFLFTIVIVLISLITISIIYKRIDERMESQMERIAAAISNMGFILSDDFLKSINIDEVIGSHIITFKYDGAVISTTLSRDNIGEIISVIISSDIKEALSKANGKSLIRNVSYLGQPHKIIYRLLEASEDQDDIIISLIASTGDIALAKRRSAITIGLVAISGIFLMAMVGSIIARSITAPVKQLVRITERISSGDFNAEVKIQTRDEIGALANSFNQMTRELKISRDKLVQSERLAAVGQIAAGVAHEIRNPLTSIKMIAQLIKRRFQEDETGQKQIQAVLDEIGRLEIIINDLLDFARPMQLSLKPSNIAFVMEDVLNIMTSSLNHKKVELIKDIDNNLPEVMIDINKMKQVFMNLILNSMQSMPDGGKLSIKCYKEHKSVIILIEDTGSGMSKETLSQAFDPFFSTKPGGAGLGLSNVKKILEQHGGKVHLKSQLGHGTRVIIEITAD